MTKPKTAIDRLRAELDKARRRGISFAELARRSKLNASTISRIAAGKISPTLDTAERLLRVLGRRLKVS